MNPTTRRHPRTLQEAFGPYTSNHIEEPQQPWTIRGLAAAVGMAVLALALSSCVSSANAQIMSAGNLAAHIQSDNVNTRAHAGYYMMGVFDAYKDTIHCAPKSVTIEQLLPFASAVIVQNQQHHSKPADHVLGYFFGRAWPCTKSEKGNV